MIVKPVIALVTAYNEEKTIGRVLDVLKKSSKIDRIQVVDDGSTDNTATIAMNKDVKVISLPKRILVGKAIMHHLTNIPERDCTLLWCDADLINLNIKHIETILSNLENNDVSMSIGVKDNIPFIPIRATRLFPVWFINQFNKLVTMFDMHVGGERAIHRSVFDKAIKNSRIANGYGIVVLLNWYCKNHANGYVVELMNHLTHRNKYQKWGITKLFEIPAEITQFLSSYIRIRLNIHNTHNKRNDY